LSLSHNELIGSVQSFHRASSREPPANCHAVAFLHPDPGSFIAAPSAPFSLGVLQIHHGLVTDDYSDYISPQHRRGADATQVHCGLFRSRFSAAGFLVAAG
jgi:hypothetical protein